MLDLSNTLVLAFIVILIGAATLIYYIASNKSSSNSSGGGGGTAQKKENFTIAHPQNDFFTDEYTNYENYDVENIHYNNNNNMDENVGEETIIASKNSTSENLKQKCSIDKPIEMAFIGHESNISWSAPELVLKFVYHKALNVDLHIGKNAYVSSNDDKIQVNQLLRNMTVSSSAYDKRALYIYCIGTRCYLREGLSKSKFEKLEQYLLGTFAPKTNAPTSIVLNIRGGNSTIKTLVNLSAKNVSKYKFSLDV